MPYASLTKKDETASKIPAPGPGGIGACGPAGGLASVAFIPVWCVIGPFVCLYESVKSSKREKKEAEARAAEEQVAADRREKRAEARKERREQARAGDGDGEVQSDDGSATVVGDEADNGVMSVQAARNNPRICDSECPGYGQPKCFVHDREDRKPGGEKKLNPGLLDV